MSRLTDKMARFALLVFAGETGTDAWLKAYDGSRTKRRVAAVKACELLKHPAVAAYLAELRREAQAQAMISVDQVLADLHEIKERALGRMAPPPVAGAQGDLFLPAAGAETDLETARKTLDLIGRHLGMFGSEAGEGGERKRIEECSDDELRQRALERSRRALPPAARGGGDGGGAGAGAAPGGAEQL